MRSVPALQDDDLARTLLALLYDGAPPEAFAARLRADDGRGVRRAGAADAVTDAMVRKAMAIRDRLELHQQREQGLLAVIESAEDLSCRLDLHGLLHALVARARTLLASHVAWLSVYDDARAEFQVVATDGALSIRTTRMVACRDRGVAGVVLATRLPFATSDYLDDRRFGHDAELDAVFRDEGIASLVGVPLIREGDVVGLLFVADRYHRVHMPQSIAILCTLATHGAVAIRNAREFERANAALDDARRQRAELERHARDIQAAADAHEEMTSLLARGAALSTLCEAVARRLAGRVLVLDEGGRVVASGVPGGDDRSLAYDLAHDRAGGGPVAQSIHRSRRIGRSVVAFERDGETCRVTAVIGGAGVVGAVVLFHRDPLPEPSIRTFERSASVVGIVLLSEERVEATRNRDAATLLRQLVSQRHDDTAPLDDRARQHGLDLGVPLALMVVAIDGPGAGYAARRFRTQTPIGGALIDEIDGVLVVLCAADRAADARRTVSTWARHELGAAHRGVLSRPVAGANGVAGLHATLCRALTLLGRLGIADRIVDQNELALYSTLFETHDAASLSAFLDATIGGLLTHDRQRDASLAATLLAYLDHDRNAQATAARLHVHVNTIRQRLATIGGLLGPWNVGPRALEVHVALRLWQLGATGAVPDAAPRRPAARRRR